MATSVTVPTHLPPANGPKSQPPKEQPQAVTSQVNGREFVYFLGTKSLGGAFLNWEANKIAKTFVGIFWLAAMVIVGLFELCLSGWIRKIYSSYLEEKPKTPPAPAEKETPPAPKTESPTNNSEKPQTEPAKRAFQHFLPTPDEYDQLLHGPAEAPSPQLTPASLPLPPAALKSSDRPNLPDTSTPVESLPPPLARPAQIETPIPSNEPATETPPPSRNWTKIALGTAAAGTALLGAGYQFGPIETGKQILSAAHAVSAGTPAVKAIWNHPNLKKPAVLAGTVALGLDLYTNGLSETFNHGLSALVSLGQARRVLPEAQAIWQNNGLPAALGATAAAGIGLHFLGAESTINHGLKALSALSLKRSLSPFANSGFQLAKEWCSEAGKKAWNNKMITAIGITGALALGYAAGPVAIAKNLVSGLWSALPLIHMGVQELNQLQKAPSQAAEQNEAEPSNPTQDLSALSRLFVNSPPEMQQVFLAQLPPDQGRFANFLRELATHSPEECEEIFTQLAAAQSASRGRSSSDS